MEIMKKYEKDTQWVLAPLAHILDIETEERQYNIRYRYFVVSKLIFDSKLLFSKSRDKTGGDLDFRNYGMEGVEINLGT